jgi:asparagine synthase (glutamine-hydrolysing)
MQTDLHTYTVSVNDSATDEAPLAARVAQHFGTTHHALAVDSHAIVRDWPSILSHLDQPTGDAINSYCVSRVVRESGVKCVLSGVGGDEAFGGYPSFRRIPRARALARLPRRMVATMAAGAALATPARASRVRQIARSDGDVGGIYRGLRGLLMPDEIDSFAGPLLQASPEAWARAASVDHLNTEALGQETDSAAVARLESCVYMRAQLLRDIDAMSMAHGLEVRMPFVDHELVASVWPALGRHPHLLRRKRLLTSALPSPLPADVTDGPKRGFTLPFSRWMAGPLSDMVRSGMRDLATDGWIAADAPDRVWTTWRAGRAHWSRPWALGVLGRFLRDA